MQKIIIPVLILIVAVFVLRPYFFNKNVSKENYPEYFYKSIPSGDVTSSECLRQWTKYNQEFEDKRMYANPRGPFKKIDYVYDYPKKRCLVESYIDSLEGTNLFIRTEITDLINNKILWESELTSGSEGVHRTADDSVNHKTWDSKKVDVATIPEFRLSDLKKFVK